MTGPFEVFARVPGGQIHLVWKTRDPVRSDTGLAMLPDTELAGCPQLDVVCVPGGPGVAALMEDAEVLDVLRRQAAGARFVTSVCTGALVLGAAGLLRGKRATTHWASHDFLAALGAMPVHERWVRDGGLVTGGGAGARGGDAGGARGAGRARRGAARLRGVGGGVRPGGAALRDRALNPRSRPLHPVTRGS